MSTEILAAIITVFGGGILTAIGFTYRKLWSLDVRVARLEEHFGVSQNIPIRHNRK